jgi:acetate kinase
LVTAHIGAGASLCAVAAGRSVDTTMGFTPLEGLVMATRSGSVDPGLVLWLVHTGGLDPDDLHNALERRSGLLGLSGTADLREVLSRAAAGDGEAALAYAVYLHRLRRELGAMVAALGGVDAFVFTGGAGEASPQLRADACEPFAFVGLSVDGERNSEGDGDRIVSSEGARPAVLAITAREDLEIVRQVEALLGG